MIDMGYDFGACARGLIGFVSQEAVAVARVCKKYRIFA